MADAKDGRAANITCEEAMTPDPVPQMRLYTHWLSERRGLHFDSYEALWRWSVEDLEAFWRSIWDYHDVCSPTAYKRVLAAEKMPGAVWFEGARVNFCAQVLRHVEAAEAAGQPAVIAENERGEVVELSWRELRRQVAALALTLRDRGVGAGDRVAAYLPNGPEAIVAFLASASLGAVWSVCAPDMGVQAILDRFRQIEPKALIAADGVRYAGKALDRCGVVSDLLAGLPSVETTIVVETPEAKTRVAFDMTFGQAITRPAHETDAFAPEFLAFDHPLWIVYSSGTTGQPKAIVHSHGGALVTFLAAAKHTDLGASYDRNTFGDRFHWYSSTGWIMWNCQVAGLLSGTTICLFDGSPSGPKDALDWGVLWRFAARHRVTLFGAGAAFYTSAMRAGIELDQFGDLTAIRALGSTGSPLPPEVQLWGAEQFAAVGRPDIWWCNLSGGTDIAGAFVTANRDLAPSPGRMQCRHLGAAVEAWDDNGRAVVGAVGELVCVKPMPGMPIYFWNDPDDSQMIGSYFDMFPGVWRHGDWIQIDAHGVCAISGRSDATINRQGLRMGASEIYSAVERLPEIADCMVVDLETGVGESELLMFVVLGVNARLDAGLRGRIGEAIRSSLSPRFVPDEIVAAPAVPRTLSGKKQEVPIKRLLQGHAVAKIINRDAMLNPDSLDWFIAFQARRGGASRAGGG
jgi:acetoacetyl-CoA synthetase